MTVQTEVKQSAVPFVGNMRMHVALNVSDLDQSLEFYRKVFNTEPTKIRPGYAKFEPEMPSINFTLNQVKGASSGGALSHFGVQLKDTGMLQIARERFEAASLPMDHEKDSTCCYATQDKFWLTDPDGNRLEFFVVLVADAYSPEDPVVKASCCAG